MPRPCLACGTVSEQSYCPAHRRTTSQRGYGGEHTRIRKQLRATLPAPCGYCGVMIYPLHPWHAAHVVDGAPEYGYMVAHPSCNERAKRR